ncbi:hypothetical protein DFQ27_009385 [Actinomortierella ambigua]|uniref:Rhodanese domain-containing protein n=1 Tax=Actinomortierella ambigua TaxID=1343610 RepID=A0A9P6PRD8_9FUNG|nr:hypothetical protein DFQ27_009385 [Actinomortierella ambigua]
MNSMTVEPDSFFAQSTPTAATSASASASTSSSTDIAPSSSSSSSATAMDIDAAERTLLPSMRDGLPPEASSAAFTWGTPHHHHHQLHVHHNHVHPHHHNHHSLSQYDIPSSSSAAAAAAYIATPSVFATPYGRDFGGDYFGNATAADAIGGSGSGSSSASSSAAGEDFFTAAQTPSAVIGAISSTTASLPPSVLQRFQAAARHSPGIVLPPRTPAADHIETFAASSPSYFPSTDPDPSQQAAAFAAAIAASAPGTTNTTTILSSSPSSSLSLSSTLTTSTTTTTTTTHTHHPHLPPPHPSSGLVSSSSSFQLPPTPFMPPAPHARHGGAGGGGGVSGPDLSWVPYPPNSRTNPLPNRRSTTHLSLSAPLNMPSVSALQKSLSTTPRPLHRHSTINLPPATELEPVDPALVAKWMHTTPETTTMPLQRNVLLLDMRPSVNYATSTIRQAINISIPNMLLKRPMFSLAMVMDQLTSDRELALFAEWKQYSHLVFFDAAGAVPVVGSPTFCMVQKFQREGCSAKLWYLQARTC